VLRRKYTATMRQTVVLEWPTQLKHGLHLLCVITASVISRAVANQQMLEAAGPGVLGKMYATVAVMAGITVVAVGFLGQSIETRRLTRAVHLLVTLATVAVFFVPNFRPEVAVVGYVLMEVAFAATLLTFGLTLGASLGPREARKVAAKVGAGGVVGGLLAGAILSVGALLIGSRALYLVAAAFVLAPVFFLPTPTSKPTAKITSPKTLLARERADVRSLNFYGGWVAVSTVLMVAATTLIDYVYRFAATQHFDADKMTAFFGFVAILSGVVTVIFQLTLLDRCLDRLGLFGTAILMPSLLILCLAGFGLAPAVATLVILKTMDSGANMSLQQATGSLLLAPLSARARSVWQSRIDGIAKRGGQVLTGLFLSFFPLAPTQVLPLSLVLCALWIVAVLVTRTRYVTLLTDMLGAAPVAQPEVSALDGATLRLLETELANATPERAAVVLDILERADHRAPEHLLIRLVEADPKGFGAYRVIDHVANLGDSGMLLSLVESPHPDISATALLALWDIDQRHAAPRCRKVLTVERAPEVLAATAAGLMAAHEVTSMQLARRLVLSSSTATRLALAHALGRAEAGSPQEIGDMVADLARDPDAEIARAAFESLGLHPTTASSEVAITALRRRDVRGAAMRALAEMGPPVVPRLVEELEQNLDDPSIANALTWTLGKLGSGTAAMPLLDALRAPIVYVRLGAAVALSALARRQVSLAVSAERLEEHCIHEIAYFSHMRRVARAGLPGSAASTLLLRSLKQRAQASLEVLFRMLSLLYPEDSMQAAFQAISSSDARKRQIAIELLDAILNRRLVEAIADAVSAVREKERAHLDMVEALQQLAEGPDRFLASLTRASLKEIGRPIRARLEEGEVMTQSLVDQILELQSLSLFAQSTAEDLGEVATLVKAKRANPGTVLFREGEPGDAMYLIRSGEVTLSRAGKIIDHVGAGEACGIVSVLDQLPRELTATVSMEAGLLVLRGDDLTQLLADRPLLMHSVFRALTSSLRSQIDRVSLGKKSEEWSW